MTVMSNAIGVRRELIAPSCPRLVCRCLVRWLSAFCLLVITLVVLLVVFGSPVYASYYRSKPNHDPGLDAAITYWDWTGAVAKFGSIVFALSCSPAVLHAYTAMFPRSERWGSSPLLPPSALPFPSFPLFSPTVIFRLPCAHPPSMHPRGCKPLCVQGHGGTWR